MLPIWLDGQTVGQTDERSVGRLVRQSDSRHEIWTIRCQMKKTHFQKFCFATAHAYAKADARARLRAEPQPGKQKHARARASMHAVTHAHTDTHKRSHTQTHTRTHTHTHTPRQSSQPSPARHPTHPVTQPRWIHAGFMVEKTSVNSRWQQLKNPWWIHGGKT